MQAEPFFVTLRRILSPEDCARVVSALHQDSLVWAALSDPQIFQTCLKNLGTQARDWTPAAIGLSVLCSVPGPSELQAQPMISINQDYRRLAVHTYEETCRNGTRPSNLEQSVILSLALRERRRLTGSWQGLPFELGILPASGEPHLTSIWSTPLTCLYGMIPDPDALLESLTTTGALNAEDVTSIVCHILISQPVGEPEHTLALLPVISRLSRSIQMTWFEYLTRIGQESLGSSLAVELLKAEPDAHPASRYTSAEDYAASGKPVGFSHSLSELEDIRCSAELYRLAGNPDHAAYLLQQVSEGLRCVHSRILADAADSISAAGNNLAAIEYLQKSIELAPEIEINHSELASVLGSSGSYPEAISVLDGAPSGHQGLVTRTIVNFHAGDLDLARQSASQAVTGISQLNHSVLSGLDFSAMPEFLEILLRLDLPEEAAQVSAQVLKVRPSEAVYHSIYSRAQLACKQPAHGRQSAQLALALCPTDVHLRRQVAAAHEYNHDWENALVEWKTILQPQIQRNPDDILSVARCSLEAGHPEEAILACEEVYLQNPYHGPAHTIHGQALHIQGKIPAALEHFTQAVTHSPEIASPWLVLAEIEEARGSRQHALEILRSGSQAAPASPDIQHALAEICLQNGAPSEALPALRKAAQLDPDSAKIAIRLGDILRSLGHLDESAAVLQRAMRYSETNGELGFELAKTCIAAGCVDQAISALEIKLAESPADEEACLLYARLVLESNANHPGTLEISCRLKQAEDALQGFLAASPNHSEAGILLAEVITAAGRTEEALDCYQSLAEKHPGNSSSWSWRIQLGLSNAALAAHQVDLALAAVQEAVSMNPGNLAVQKHLAETCLAASLFHEALQAGSSALSLSANNPAELMWYAGLACACGSQNDAISALEHAADYEHASVEPHLRLAQMELLANNPPAARSALSTILHYTSASAGDLQKASYLYLQAGDIDAAEECLLKATETGASVDCWVELARVRQMAGRVEHGLETVQTGITLFPSDPRLHMLEAALLVTQKRIDAGLDALIKVIPVKSSAQPVHDHEILQQAGFPPILAPALLAVAVDQASVLSTTADFLRQRGSLPEAVEKALQALECKPEDPAIRLQAISSAHSLLDLDLAYSLVSEATASTSILNVRLDAAAKTALLCARAELELDLEQLEDAAQTFQQANAMIPDLPQVLAGKAYLAAINGDFLEAETSLEKAIRRLDSISTTKNPASPTDSPNSGLGFSYSNSEYPSLSIARSALQLHQWGLAFPLYEQALRNAPGEARTHLAFACAIVQAQEAEKCRRFVKITAHTAPVEYTGAAGRLLFDREIQLAARLSSCLLVESLQLRAAAVFDSAGLDDAQSAALAEEKTNAPAFGWALYETRNLPAILEGDYKGSETPAGMLPRALALLANSPEQSLTYAKHMACQTPNQPVHQAALAIIAQAANDEVEGLQAIEQALQIWPDESEWHALAADLSITCGDGPNELRHWELAQHLAPDNLDYTLALGQSYLTNHNQERGIEVLAAAAESHPGSADAWLALASACLASKDFERALTCAEKAAILAPELPEPRLISGQINLQAGQVGSARVHASAVLERDPGEAQAMLILVNALISDGKPAEALSYIEKSAMAARSPYPLLYQKTILLKQLSGTETAIQAVEALIQEYPREAILYRDLAQLQAESGMRAEAEQAAQAALRLQPYQPELHLLVGSLQRTTGQLDQAVYHLSESIHQNPEFTEGYLELGRAYSDRHEYTQALAVLRQGMEASPSDPRPCYQAALVLKETKDYVGAEAMLRRAAALAPDDVTIRRQLGALIALNLVHNPVEAVR